MASGPSRRSRRQSDVTMYAYLKLAAGRRASSSRSLHNGQRRSMRTLDCAHITIAFLALLVFASSPRNLAIAHEGHQMECKKISMQAIKADIQAMSDGEAKLLAMKEMKIAEEMMDKKDANACK